MPRDRIHGSSGGRRPWRCSDWPPPGGAAAGVKIRAQDSAIRATLLSLARFASVRTSFASPRPGRANDGATQMLPNIIVVICGIIVSLTLLVGIGASGIRPQSYTRIGETPEISRPMIQRIVADSGGAVKLQLLAMARRDEELGRLRAFAAEPASEELPELSHEQLLDGPPRGSRTKFLVAPPVGPPVPLAAPPTEPPVAPPEALPRAEPVELSELPPAELLEAASAPEVQAENLYPPLSPPAAALPKAPRVELSSEPPPPLETSSAQLLTAATAASPEAPTAASGETPTAASVEAPTAAPVEAPTAAPVEATPVEQVAAAPAALPHAAQRLPPAETPTAHADTAVRSQSELSAPISAPGIPEAGDARAPTKIAAPTLGRNPQAGAANGPAMDSIIFAGTPDIATTAAMVAIVVTTSVPVFSTALAELILPLHPTISDGSSPESAQRSAIAVGPAVAVVDEETTGAVIDSPDEIARRSSRPRLRHFRSRTARAAVFAHRTSFRHWHRRRRFGTYSSSFGLGSSDATYARGFTTGYTAAPFGSGSFGINASRYNFAHYNYHR